MRLKKFLILSIPITYSKYHCLLVCLELLHYWVSPRTCPRSKAGPRWETFVFYLMFIWTTLSLGFYKSTFLWKKNEWNSCCNADKQLTLPVVLDISFNFRFSDFRDGGRWCPILNLFQIHFYLYEKGNFGAQSQDF